MRLGGAVELSTVMFACSGSGSFWDRSLFHHTFTLSHSPRPYTCFGDWTLDVGDGNCSLRLKLLLCPHIMIHGCSSGGEGTRSDGLLHEE